jgi:hypothetical protein
VRWVRDDLDLLESECHYGELTVAKNTGEGGRKGAIKARVQALNPVTKRYVKIDTDTGRIIDHKRTAGPYKGIREVYSPKHPK